MIEDTRGGSSRGLGEAEPGRGKDAFENFVGAINVASVEQYTGCVAEQSRASFLGGLLMGLKKSGCCVVTSPKSAESLSSLMEQDVAS
jgi:hypothetical protein